MLVLETDFPILGFKILPILETDFPIMGYKVIPILELYLPVLDCIDDTNIGSRFPNNGL